MPAQHKRRGKQAKNKRQAGAKGREVSIVVGTRRWSDRSDDPYRPGMLVAWAEYRQGESAC